MVSYLWGVPTATGELTEYNRSNGGIELLSMECCLFLRTPLQFLHILTAFSHFSALSLSLFSAVLSPLSGVLFLVTP